MVRNSRKVTTFIIASLMALFTAAAIPPLLFAQGDVTPANAAETTDTQTDPAQQTAVPALASYSFEYSGAAYGLNTSLYKLGKIQTADGQDVTEAKNAGKYTIYYTPAANCEWEDEGGTAEKSFALTIEKATLRWYYPSVQTEMKNPSAEIVYMEQRTNQMDKVSATGVGNTFYNNGEHGTAFNVLKGDLPIKNFFADAGTYTFTVPDYYNYDNPTFTLTIKPLELDIGQYINFQWVKSEANNAEGKSLNAGEIYTYTYNVHGSAEQRVAYTARKLDKAPFMNWENWKSAAAEPISVAHGMLAYCEDQPITVKLNRDRGDMAYFNAAYSGETTAQESGKYVAEAQVTPVDNYRLIYDAADPSQDMEITPNPDGTFTVKKTWYIVYYVNDFISETSIQTAKIERYAFPSGWTYGKLPKDGVTAPCLEHGDEVRMRDLLGPNGYPQPSGYRLLADGVGVFELNGTEAVYYEGMESWQTGESDLVTFTIMKDGETVCTNEPRTKFSYYVNEYMPVGNYTITFKAKRVGLGPRGVHNEWWNGNGTVNCGSEYTAITETFNFTVTPATLVYDDGDLSYDGIEGLPPAEVNGADLVTDFEKFFNVSEGKIKYENALTKSAVLESNTYWATVADHYFGDPQLSYKLDGDIYYPISDGKWSELIKELGTYRVYYTVTVPNYLKITDAARLSTQYFLVNVFEFIEQPVLLEDTFTYTGEPITVHLVEDDARYTYTGTTQTAVGDYEVVFTIADPVKYHWKGADGAVCKKPWSIVRKTNSWKEGGQPQIIGWTWGSYDRTVNIVTALPVDGTPVFFVTEDEAGAKPVKGLESFLSYENGKVTADIGNILAALPAGEHYLWASVEQTDIYSSIAPALYKFTVAVADNAWLNQPEPVKWTVGSANHFPLMQAKYGDTEYKIASETDPTAVYYDTAEKIDALVQMPAGRYVLTAYVKARENAYTGVSVEIPLPVYAKGVEGVWVVLPSIEGWDIRNTPNAPQGVPAQFGSTVEYKYYTKAGEPLEGVPDKAGEYVMVATAYAKDGTEIASESVDFILTGGSNAWVIVLCCVLGGLVLIGGALFAVFFVRRKRGNAEAEQPAAEEESETERMHSDELELDEDVEEVSPAVEEQPVAEEPAEQPIEEVEPIEVEQPEEAEPAEVEPEEVEPVEAEPAEAEQPAEESAAEESDAEEQTDIDEPTQVEGEDGTPDEN